MAVGIGNDIVIGRHMGVRLTGGGAASVLLVHDAFTDTNGTLLSAHTIAPTNVPSTAWTIASEGSLNIQVQSNKAVASGEAGAARTYAYCDAGVATGITVESTVNAASQAVGLVVRWQDINTHWLVFASVADQKIILFERIAGTYNNRAEVAATVTADTDYILSCYLNGDVITVYLDGVSLFQYTSSALNSQTRHGMRCNNQTTRVDDFKVYTGPFA